jgi:AraC-like DNA-binding protein
VKFNTYIPLDILKPYVRTLAISESEMASTYKVLPGTEVVIGFQFKGKLSYADNNQETPLSSSGLTGLNDSYRIFRNTKDTGSVLVFFKEGAASAFFHQPIHEFFKESISLENFMLRSELLILEEKLQESKSDKQRISAVEQFLISKLNPGVQDLLVLSAISMIYKSKGNIRIKDLAKALHSSQSPLEKRFRGKVGTSPKKFSSLVRFKNSIDHYRPDRSLTDLSYEMGFYDQAHFIKEFRNFTGDSPEIFFDRG